MRKGASTTRGWPVRLVIASMAVGSMALVAAVLITLSWFGSRQILLDTAAVAARDAGQITVERARRMIDPGSAALRSLAFDPIVSAANLDERLARVPVLAAELAANPLVSAIYVGYANGDFLLVRPLADVRMRQQFRAPSGAAYLVQTVTRAAGGGQQGAFHFYGAGDGAPTHRPMPAYRYDPRERPWYAAAADPQATAISGPYVFFSTRQLGVSLSRPARDGQAVVGLDMALDDLGAGLDELRMTPGAELALVDARGAVLAYRDMGALWAAGAGKVPALQLEAADPQPLEALEVEALSRLQDLAADRHGGGPAAAPGQAVSYQAAGREWLGMVLPFDGIEGIDLRLLAAAPADELLGDLQRNRDRMILIAAILILLLLPLGWWAGSAVGKALEGIAAQARRMSRFDFSRPPARYARLREVSELDEVMRQAGVTVEAFLSVSQVLGAERRIETMLAQVLEKLVGAARCEGGAVYLWRKDEDGMAKVAAFGEQAGLEALIAMPPHGCQPPLAPRADGRRRIAFELKGRKGELQGLLVLLHVEDTDHAAPEFQAFAGRLTGMLAVAIETRQLIDGQKALFDAVIRLLAHAIDAKSPYTGGHCERVPQLAIMLADRMAGETAGPYAGFALDEEERYAFHLAAWLHDCGKITSPDHIIDKATKLEGVYNRIHEIRMRFEVLWRDAEIEYLLARLEGRDAALAARTRDARREQLREDFGFVAACNRGSEGLSGEAVARLARIGATAWQRHFDDSLGLSDEEAQRLARRGERPALPATERLLADKPEHIVPWDARKPCVERGDPGNTLGFDMRLPPQRRHLGELHNLSVRRGTLSEEDRFAVNDHIVQTLIMLKQLPWPRHLDRVPDIAANHHERMDGEGYPRRIPAGELPVTDRIMAVADVFEALTAPDRPYASPKTLSESLRIMAGMSRSGHLDAGLYRYFLRSRVWLDYARQFMRPAQIDEVDIEALAGLAGPREPAGPAPAMS